MALGFGFIHVSTMQLPVPLLLVLLAALGSLSEGASLGCPETAVTDTPAQIARQQELSAQFLGHWPGDPFIPLDGKVEALAAQVGLTSDVLRYFLGCLFCYVLALVHAWLVGYCIPPPDPKPFRTLHTCNPYVLYPTPLQLTHR